MTLRRLGASPPHVVASSPSSLPAKRTLATGTQPVCPWELSPARFGGLMASSARPPWRVVAALPPVLNRPETLDSRAARTVLAAVSSRAMTRRADACAVGRSHKVLQRRQAINPVLPPHPARALSGGDCCFRPGCERVPGPSNTPARDDEQERRIESPALRRTPAVSGGRSSRPLPLGRRHAARQNRASGVQPGSATGDGPSGSVARRAAFATPRSPTASSAGGGCTSAQ